MSVLEVRFKKSASKELQDLPLEIQQKIWDLLPILKSSPLQIPAKKMQGMEDVFRIRIGVYRLLYHLDTKARILTIFRIDHRKDVYR